MSQSLKRNLSIIAIVIASVAAGVILTADLGWMRRSLAQQTSTIQSQRGPVSSVTIPSFADVAERVMPSVVSITSTEVVKAEDMRKFHGGIDPFDFFFPDPRRRPQQEEGEQDDDDQRRQVSGGSGFIISPDGYILTNNHVIEDATKVEVHYGDTLGGRGKTATAKIIGRDPATDLALLKIDVKEQLPAVRFGDSDKIRIGDWAIAIGNPLQFENTLTVGVISGFGRSLGISEATQSFENFIQTDAAINYGNSGGPLMNINGEVIGINTAIRAYAQNIGFAVPVNVAKRIYPQLKDKGRVTRGYLGIRIADVDNQTKEAWNLPEATGALIQGVEPGQPADKAGLQHGDVIVQVDDQAVRRTRDLIDYVSDKAPGTTVKVTIIRNGSRRTMNAKVAERPSDSGQADEETQAPAETPTRSKLGISVQELSAGVRQSFGLPDNVSGIVVSTVKEVSPAGDAGLAAGDVISEVNGQRISTVEDFRKIVDAAKSGQYLRLYVTRAARARARTNSFFAIIQIP